MNNHELRKLITPVELVEITVDNLSAMFGKGHTQTKILELSSMDVASLHDRIKSFVCEVIIDGSLISASILVNNISFAYDAEDKVHIITINVPGNEDAGLEDAEVILVAKEDGIFNACDIDDDGNATLVPNIKVVYFAF